MDIYSILANTSAVLGLLNIGQGDTVTDIFVIVLSLTLIVLLVAVLIINKAVQTIYKLTMPEAWAKDKQEKVEGHKQRKTRRGNFWVGLMGLHKLEEEKDLMIEHEYDGIVELDNPIPVWFNVLFYGTVIFGIGYMMVYHVFGWGLNQDQEYEREMAQAEIARQEYLAQAADLIDENSVEIDLSMVSNGKSIYIANCAVCHGNEGEGTIGPNLTDRYWLHGGEIKDIFRTVKYGVPDKGMVPWEQTLTPGQIAEVSNYIITLRDTNPVNPKPAEGAEVVYDSHGGTGDAETTDGAAETDGEPAEE